MSRKHLASLFANRALCAARSHSSASTGVPALCLKNGFTANATSSGTDENRRREHQQRDAGTRGYASDAVSTSGSSSGSLAPVNSGAILNALKTPNSEPNYAQENHRVDKIGDPDKRAFTYFVLTGGRMIYASAIRLAVLKFLMSMSASADVLALASLEVDLSKIQPGTTTTVKWRGKPVFIRRRTADEIAKENAVDVGELRDAQTDAERTQKPEWLVVVGVCTHLGCVPIANAGDYNGWFCPCHGSHYDASGRIRKGPAPENLEVPEYSFPDETTMVVG
mmetsp:Transcript_5053/g.15013  ORF Transcript_5053/g.15013 Transcript_5053/m.15013 type:complete len:280 (-) Transcript_5053:56-895(-)